VTQNSTDTPLLEVRGLSKTFAQRRSLSHVVMAQAPRPLQAVRNVTLTLAPGETLGLVGESGCGKSTLGRCIAGFHEPTEGTVFLRGEKISGDGYDRQRLSRELQMIFQDPYSSLNPRLTVAKALEEPIRVHGLRRGRGEIADRVDELMSTVGLPPGLKSQLPHAFSGGQRQRISIARALALEPDVIIADEPVSALDVSIQAQILNLFEDLRSRLGLTYLFIAHDLNVVRHISQRIAVMYLGEIVEIADADQLFEDPQHPYTRALLSALPQPDPTRRTQAVSLEGEPPDPSSPPSGCAFNVRCPLAHDACRAQAQELRWRGDHGARCIEAFQQN
jgi:oligopeptide/dipeptide ABC transporter ATP-binding protein